MMDVAVHAVWRRRRGLLWWSIGIIAAAALVAGAYPTIRDNSSLDRTFASLPPSVLAALGLDPQVAISSPAGYLRSQFFANLLPVLLLVFGLGFATWSIGGDESAGTLELLLSNPVSRSRVALERALALVVLLGALAIVAIAVVLLLAPPTGLATGLSLGNIAAAGVATWALALTYSALAFAVGAATGNRPLALGVASAVAVGGFVIESLAAQMSALSGLRDITPWHWLLDGDPLRRGWAVDVLLPPLAVSVLLVVVGTALFARRDLS